MHTSPLGEQRAYPKRYAPEVLFAIERQTQRTQLGLHEKHLPFMGADLWTAFELSWCNLQGKPEIGIARITVDCHSPRMAESKSLKLYLVGLSYRRFESLSQVQACLVHDLSQLVGTAVGVAIVPAHALTSESIGHLEGLLLDRLHVACEDTALCPDLLTADMAQNPVQETLVSHLLKSHCAVTGQPDWGSVQITYSGQPIDQARLLRYIVSFREHNEFHEHCVERIFWDIWQRCHPYRLSVYARYTRRGGIDISPFRTSHPQALPATSRLARQ